MHLARYRAIQHEPLTHRWCRRSRRRARGDVVTGPRAPGWFLALCWQAAACAEVVSFPDDPRLVESGPWRCLGAQAPSDLGGQSTATVRMQVCDAFGDCSVPLGGLSAELCAKVDVGCTRPLDVEIREVDGLLEFDVPIGNDGFDGYLAVSSPSEPCTSP